MENENELEVNSDDTQENEEQSSEEQETSQENPEELKKKIKELEGQKNYYQSQYKKVKDKPTDEKTDDSKYLTRDEAMLIAQGYNESDIETLNTISKGKGISLKEAKDDALFKAYKGTAEQEEKSQKAQLGASSGSPTTTGSSKEDHKKKYQETLKKLQG